MKKSQLRNIIRGIIREQLDVDKNKLRPIKPEIPNPPAGGSTPNSHQQFRIKWCTPHPSYGDCYEYTYNWQQSIFSGAAITCNGQMCGPGDLNKTYTHPIVAGGNNEFELLWVAYPTVCTGWQCRDLSLQSQTGCTTPCCSQFNSWPLNDTQGCNEFDQQYGAIIAGGTPVISQWSLGGCSTYYPSQNVFCEACNDTSNPIWTTPDTSPIGTSNWLTSADQAMCACC